MSFIWTKDLSVGVEEIDGQHQQFFKLANDVLLMLEDVQITKEQAMQALQRFEDYALYHLSSEELYFGRCHYAETDIHIAAHDAFRKTVADAMKQHKTSDDHMRIILDLTLFAGNWLTKHIRDMDQRYMECFHACGLH